MKLKGKTGKAADAELRGNTVWLAAQAQALQAAVNGAPLDVSLGILIRAAIKQTARDARCAFYIADADAAELYDVSAMSDGYARCVAGFRIGPESLLGDLAAHTGEPIITPDVTKDPRWKDWLWLAKEHDYRGCWSFPVANATGKLVGTYAMYFKEPREPTNRDQQLVAALTRAAANIISRRQAAKERTESEQALKRILALEDRCARAGNKFQHSLEAILEEALFITGAPRGNLQLLEGGRGLRIAVHRGFERPFLKFFDTVTHADGASCGAALQQGGQVVVEDITSSAIFVGTPALEVLRAAQVGAVISTPFVSSAGEVMGVISTHFSRPHKLRERPLSLLRLLARQAARCCMSQGG